MSSFAQSCRTPFRGVARPLFVVLIWATLHCTALAVPLTVHLTGGFSNDNFTITYTDGSYDVDSVSATVDLIFNPTNTTCNSSNFTSTTAQINGTIVVWGSATHYAPGSANSKSFSNSYTYNFGPGVSVPITYEGQTGLGAVQDLFWQITSSVNPNNATPYALQFFGDSQTLGLWIRLPAPFVYPTDYEFYEHPGNAAVSGQQGVNSCLDGLVTDSSTGQPISAAQVSFGNAHTTSDSKGTFFYGGIPPSTYQLFVSNSGYLPYSNLLAIPPFTIVQQTVSLGTPLNVLDANPLFLGSVFLKGSRFPLDQNDPKTSAAMTALAQASTFRQGLVADGTSQLLLRFTSANPGTVTFTHSNSAAGTLSGVSTPLPPGGVPTVSLLGQNMAFALYTAPDFITTAAATDTIQASFQPSGGGGQPTTASNSITIKRTPVVLVHGLWSGPSVWNSLIATLGNNGFQGSTVSYSNWFNAAGPFAFYRGLVNNSASNLVVRMRGQGLAANRVDVVAHSMGGILARLDAGDQNGKTPDNCYLGYTRRLVTIDTPHYGSRAATLLLRLAGVNASFKNLINNQSHPIDKGGVADLDPYSFAGSVSPTNSASFLPALKLPASAICCTVSTEDDLPILNERAVYFLTKWSSCGLPVATQQSLFCNQTISKNDSEIVVANKVFTTGSQFPHDGIVPLESQDGGCASFNLFNDVAHTAAPGAVEVETQVVTLLSGSSNSFDPNGFPAVTAASVLPQKCGSGSVSGASTPTSLVNLVPTSGPTTTPGTTLNFNLQALNSAVVDDAVVMATQNGATIAIASSTNLPFAFNFTAPTNVLGTIAIVGLAANSQGQIDVEQTNIAVVPASGTTIQSLTPSPLSFGFSSIGQVAQLAITGAFSDGSAPDISDSSSGTVYSSSALSVASVNSNGLVTAVGQGSATLTVRYGAISNSIPVTVTVQPPTVLSVMPFSTLAGSVSVPFTLAGTSLGGASAIQFFRNGVLDPSISATNLSVGAAGLNLTGFVSVGSGAPPGLRTVGVTTPAGSSSTNITQGNRFFVGTSMLLSETQIVSSITNTPYIHMHILGPPGGTCVLQTSTNLGTWTPVATNSLLGGDWYFDKYLSAGQSALFYRAFVQSN